MYDPSAKISRILIVRSTRKFSPILIDADIRVMVSQSEGVKFNFYANIILRIHMPLKSVSQQHVLVLTSISQLELFDYLVLLVK